MQSERMMGSMATTGFTLFLSWAVALLVCCINMVSMVQAWQCHNYEVGNACLQCCCEHGAIMAANQGCCTHVKQKPHACCMLPAPPSTASCLLLCALACARSHPLVLLPIVFPA